MPTTRHRRERFRRPDVDPFHWALLTDQISPDHDLTDLPDGWDPFSFFSFDEVAPHLWARHGERILTEWHGANPGTRPSQWWKFDAPRLPLGTFPGCFYDRQLAEPRRHLSGPGKPLHERLNYVPAQRFGIWQWYGDPDDPPTFESQFAYLDRLGLLLPGEDEPLAEPHPHPEQIEDAAAWAKVPT